MSTTLHQRLAHELDELGLSADEPPSAERWRAFLAAVGRGYLANDDDRAAERRQLAVSLAIHEAILEASPDGVLIIREDRRVVGMNRRLIDIWGVAEDILATRDADLILAAAMKKIRDPQAVEARIRQINRNPGEAGTAELLELTDGRFIERDSAPVATPDGAFRGRVWFFRDVTERRRNEVRTRAMKETAERASRAKSDFLLNMSHEMRTPLNAILGFARVLRRSANDVLSDEQKGYLQDIVQAGGYMLQLVNDLLDLRSLEENRLEMVPLLLEPLIAQSVSLVRPLLHEKQLALDVELEPDLPRVLADRRAVVQILVNLLSNAGKYTGAGGSILVTASTDGAWVDVAVKDTGQGISAEDQARLFVYFEQLGGKRAANMKGSGVGLALTRSLVEKQGGTITVESEVGKGSTFRFRLEAVPA
jgi:PAS domain S-box-containing protein